MIRPAYSEHKVAAPSGWHALPHGAWLKERVAASLNEWWPQIFGYHLLKLGPLSNDVSSQLCPVPHQFGLDPNQGQVKAQWDALPLRSASIDACLSTFCLEFHRDPHAMLREVDRVLVSGGHLLLVGFNPASALGLGYLWPPNQERFPWKGRLFTPARVQDWLSVLGYRVMAQECLSQAALLGAPGSFSALQSWMTQWCPGLGSVYLIVAEKLDCPLTPAKPRWRVRRPLVVNPVPELAGRDQTAARQEADR